MKWKTYIAKCECLSSSISAILYWCNVWCLFFWPFIGTKLVFSTFQLLKNALQSGQIKKRYWVTCCSVTGENIAWKGWHKHPMQGVYAQPMQYNQNAIKSARQPLITFTTGWHPICKVGQHYWETNLLNKVNFCLFLLSEASFAKSYKNPYLIKGK